MGGLCHAVRTDGKAGRAMGEGEKQGPERFSSEAGPGFDMRPGPNSSAGVIEWVLPSSLKPCAHDPKERPRGASLRYKISRRISIAPS